MAFVHAFLRSFLLGSLVLLGVGLVGPTYAEAQIPSCRGTDPERAARAISAGDEAVAAASALRGRHRDDAARAAFERALASYDEACAAGTDLALERRAIPLSRLGRPLEAIESVDAFVRAHPLESLSEEDRARVESNVHAMERDVASLTVSSVPNAEVFVGGTSVGSSPLVRLRRLPQESVELVLRAPGYLDFAQQIELVPGETFRLEVRLERDPALVSVPPAPLNPVEPDIATGPAASGEDRAAAPLASARPDLTPWVVVTAAGAVVFGALGIVGTVWAIDRRLALGGACFEFGAGVGECSGIRTEHDTGAGLAVGGFVVAAALATTAIVLAVSGDDGDPRGSIACGVGPVSLGCRGRF
jgi:hypothetical protein